MEHSPECDAPRCPDCGGTDTKAGPFIDMRWCNDCETGADAAAFIPTDCRCDEIAASRAQDEAEAVLDAMEGYER